MKKLPAAKRQKPPKVQNAAKIRKAPKNQSKTRTVFVADEMLGRLCHWLRILGVPCLHLERKKQGKNKIKDRLESDYDDELIKLSINNNAVLLTRDKQLAQKAGNYCHVFLLRSSDAFEQVAIVVKHFGLDKKKFPDETLCPSCGSPVKKISKISVKKRVWPRVYEAQKQFWKCINPTCNSIYWRGSHWTKIIATGARIGWHMRKLALAKN